MTPEQFMANFGTIAEAPNGIDKLRDLVRRLGVSGRLGTENPDDEAAADLLPQIEEELSARPGKKWKGRKKALSELHRADGVPPKWLRVCLGEIVELAYGKGLSKKERNDGPIPVFGSNGIVGHHDVALVEHSCLVVGRKGSSGAVNLSAGACWPIDTTYYVVPASGTALRFLMHLMSGLGLETLGSSIVPGLNREDAYALQVLLPPLAEQKRIVAKVDQLMAMLDELEQRQEKKRTVAIHVSKASLDSLVSAKDPDQLARAWERVSTYFPVVAGADLDSVRTGVLSLAVRGALSTSNGSATELLDAIIEARLELHGQGCAQRVKPVVGVPLDEAPYALPAAWKWVRVEDLCTHIIDCLHKTPKHVEGGAYPSIRTSEIRPGELLVDQALRVDEETYQERIGRLRPEAGDVIYAREGGRYGVAATVPKDVELCLGQRTMMFRVAPGVDPEFFMWTLNSETIFAQARATVGGSASPHVNIRAIRQFPFPLPPSDEQRTVVQRISNLSRLIEKLEQVLEERRNVGSRLAFAATRT